MDATDTSVHTSIVVEAPVERAFPVFTEGIGSWFPSEYNLLEVEIAERVFEPREGGQIYDRGTDGSECHWARVLAYEPPNRVVFSWDIDPQWQIETDPERTSEVEVQFRRRGAGAHARRARAPQPRPPRRWLGADPRVGRRRGRLAGLPAAVRRAGRGLRAPRGPVS